MATWQGLKTLADIPRFHARVRPNDIALPHPRHRNTIAIKWRYRDRHGMGEANIRNLMTPQENQGFRCERTSDWGPASSASFFCRQHIKLIRMRGIAS